MNRLTQVLAAAAAALAIGAGATYAVVDRVSHVAEPNPPGDRVRAAIAGVRDDHVYVADDGRSMLSTAGEHHLQQVIGKRRLPVYVVVWQPSRNAGYDHYIEAAEQIVAGLPAPATVVLWQGPEDSTVQTSEDYRIVEEDGIHDEPSYLGDADKRLTEWVDALPDRPLEPWDRFDYYGGTGGGIAFALVIGVPSLVGLWIVIGIVRRITGRRFRNVGFGS